MPKVFLSAGHGGTDSGAVGNGLQEEDVNLQILLACGAELERHGVEVVCSRKTDENDPVGEEVREANASGADIAVSFHANAGGGDGFEAFYYSSSANGKRLAELGQKYVVELGQNSRGVKRGNHLCFVKNTKMTAVLFESFFVDNITDKAIGDTIAEQALFGLAYAKAILEYFGIAYVPITAVPIHKIVTPVDIVAELVRRGFVTDADGMIAEIEQTPNGRLYWLARKVANS